MVEEYDLLCEHVPEFKEFSSEEFYRARMMVYSRAFKILKGGKETQVMAPLADMANHQRLPLTQWRHDEER